MGGLDGGLNGGVGHCKGASSDSSGGEVAGAGRSLGQHGSTQAAGSSHRTCRQTTGSHTGAVHQVRVE